MQGVEDDKWLALFRSLYTKEFLPRLVPEMSRDLVENKDTADRREPGRSRIPFVIHHIWLGLRDDGFNLLSTVARSVCGAHDHELTRW